MNIQERKQALAWYVQGIDVQTIADHYRVTVDTLKPSLHNVGIKHYKGGTIRTDNVWTIGDSEGIANSTHGAKLAITCAIATAPRATYKIISLDVWGNEKDGFEVNDAHYTGDTITVSSLATDADIVRAMKDTDLPYLYKHIKTSYITIEGEPEYTLYLVYAPTGEPLFQLERVQD